MLAYAGRGPFEVRRIDPNRLIEKIAHWLETVISKKAVPRFEVDR